jgi:DNA-binding NtrC family response regulator
MQTTTERLYVLMLSGPESECAVSLQEALTPQVEFTIAHSLAECLRQVQRAEYSEMHAVVAPSVQSAAGFHAFLCEWCYQGGTWREAVELMHRRAPHLPVIVVCRTGGESEWVEVLEAGAFDLISAPFSKEQVLDTLLRAAEQSTEEALVKTA